MTYSTYTVPTYFTVLSTSRERRWGACLVVGTVSGTDFAVASLVQFGFKIQDSVQSHTGPSGVCSQEKKENNSR